MPTKRDSSIYQLLLRELRGLERRRSSAGRDRVDHRPGAHDDLANAVAGAIVKAFQQGKEGFFPMDVITYAIRTHTSNGPLVPTGDLRG